MRTSNKPILTDIELVDPKANIEMEDKIHKDAPLHVERIKSSIGQLGTLVPNRGCLAVRLAQELVTLLGINAALPELGSEYGPIGIDYQGGIENGEVRPGPAGAACPQEGSLDEGVVSKN